MNTLLDEKGQYRKGFLVFVISLLPAILFYYSSPQRVYNEAFSTYLINAVGGYAPFFVYVASLIVTVIALLKLPLNVLTFGAILVNVFELFWFVYLIWTAQIIYLFISTK